ncbi:MAG: sigma-54-dependent Fis family transcriptional regulator [Bacteroidaceae bacterium]|nr:sigma-54-dependent Fis family transcriptional regulator [Bacteroidaceae bacterium]
MTEALLRRTKERYNIVGNCEELNRAIDVALKIAPVDLSVLVVGENGVGKEVFPRIIHDNSKRKSKNYIAINCGAIPEGTIDSELFGHVEGAYTGAIGAREGYFSAANGGTLFLDEVGELPLATQARLLRVLETGEYIPVGSSEVRKTNVRIVAATNVNMEKAIADGRFREDLYYRLNCVSISVPPLRHRGQDIIMLFRLFAMEMNEQYGVPLIRLTPEAEGMLLNYSWPGNVRQLKNIATNMCITTEDHVISSAILSKYLPTERHRGELVVVNNTKEDEGGQVFQLDQTTIIAMLYQLRNEVDELKSIIKGRQALPMPTTHVVTDKALAGNKGKIFTHSDYEECVTEEVIKDELDGATKAQKLCDVEYDVIKRILTENNFNRKIAAQKLGISERTLYRKIKEYDLE